MKPIIIEAFQLTYNAARGRELVPVWAVQAVKDGIIQISYTDKIEGSQTGVIKTPDKDIFVSPNDWIIKGIEGDFSVCKSNCFNDFYEISDNTSN